MPVLPGGTVLEQKAVTVANNDTDINNDITTQGNDGWVVAFVLINPSGTTVILFYSRTTSPA